MGAIVPKLAAGTKMILQAPVAVPSALFARTMAALEAVGERTVSLEGCDSSAALVKRGDEVHRGAGSLPIPCGLVSGRSRTAARFANV